MASLKQIRYFLTVADLGGFKLCLCGRHDARCGERAKRNHASKHGHLPLQGLEAVGGEGRSGSPLPIANPAKSARYSAASKSIQRTAGLRSALRVSNHRVKGLSNIGEAPR